MLNLERVLFLLLLLSWIGLISCHILLGGYVHLLPLAAVLVLVKRLRRNGGAHPPGNPPDSDDAEPPASGGQENGRPLRQPFSVL